MFNTPHLPYRFDHIYEGDGDIDQSKDRKPVSIIQPAGLIFLDALGEEMATKMELRSQGTTKNPCDGGASFLFRGRCFFLGAGGQLKRGFNMLSSDLGVSTSSTSCPPSPARLFAGMVLMALIGGNSAATSRPMI